jgi:hypothetical protein
LDTSLPGFVPEIEHFLKIRLAPQLAIPIPSIPICSVLPRGASWPGASQR